MGQTINIRVNILNAKHSEMVMVRQIEKVFVRVIRKRTKSCLNVNIYSTRLVSYGIYDNEVRIIVNQALYWSPYQIGSIEEYKRRLDLIADAVNHAKQYLEKKLPYSKVYMYYEINI